MRSKDITKEQARRLDEMLFKHVNYLVRLQKRLEDLRFDRDDPLYVKIEAAREALLGLAHYAHGLSPNFT